MTSCNDTPPVTEFARLVSELIPGLRQSVSSIEIGPQLDRALSEHAAILHRVELGFAQFLDALFRQFAQPDDLDAAARAKLKLIERRLAPYLAAAAAPAADRPGTSSLELQIASMLWADRTRFLIAGYDRVVPAPHMDQAECNELLPPWRNPAPEKRWCRRCDRARFTELWLANYSGPSVKTLKHQD